MEEHDQDIPRIRVVCLTPIVFLDNLSTLAAAADLDYLSGRSRKDGLSGTEPKMSEATDGGGDPAQSPALIQDTQQLLHEGEGLCSERPVPQDNFAPASASPSGCDNPEGGRISDLLDSGVANTSVLTSMETELVLKNAELNPTITDGLPEAEAMKPELLEEGAGGEMLKSLVAGKRKELKLLRKDMMEPGRLDEDEPAPILLLDCTNDGDKDGATDLHHAGTSQLGPGDKAPPCPSSQVFEDD